jgi:hypothetical protein
MDGAGESAVSLSCPIPAALALPRRRAESGRRRESRRRTIVGTGEGRADGIRSAASDTGVKYQAGLRGIRRGGPGYNTGWA